MRRLALLAAAVFTVAAAPAARAEPLDLDLSRLGPPTPTVWALVNPALSGAQRTQYALESRQRFATLSAQTALALSSAVLHPASTTGHSGFAADLEAAAMPVSSKPLGVAAAGYSNDVWPGVTQQPTLLFMPSLHARKGLPFSFEIGGRFIYLAMSNAFAGQGEAKWALHEGFEYHPEIAIRAAYTQLFGVKDWNLSTADFDFMVSKRFGLLGVTSLTPYVVARLTYVYASSERINFAPDATMTPAETAALANTAEFPRFVTNMYRTTAGLRFTVYAVSMTVEGTYFAGSTAGTKNYNGTKIASALGGAAKLGWEW
jgi:hypothetical protein